MKQSQLIFACMAAVAVTLGGCAELALWDEEPAVEQQPAQVITTPRSATPQTVQGQGQPGQQAAPASDRIAQVAQQLGLRKCVPRVKQITGFLTANTQHDGHFFAAPRSPDQQIASVALEVQTGNQLSLVDTNFAPGQGPNECGGIYETITYWNKGCPAVASQNFASLKRGKPLHQAIASLESGPNVRIFLMPAGQGCVAIKKEIVYDW